MYMVGGQSVLVELASWSQNVYLGVKVKTLCAQE